MNLKKDLFLKLRSFTAKLIICIGLFEVTSQCKLTLTKIALKFNLELNFRKIVFSFKMNIIKSAAKKIIELEFSEINTRSRKYVVGMS